MKLNIPSAEIYIPDRVPENEALERTTHLAIAAHQDDIEIMAVEAILTCFGKTGKWFTGVVVTDGRGSPREGDYQAYSDDKMRLVRRKEQKKAAIIGEYSAVLFLDYPSKVLKGDGMVLAVDDLLTVLTRSQPKFVYTHNLADKHDTHIAVAWAAIKAIRLMHQRERPHKLYGCEVWRDLDWLLDEDKVVFDTSAQENLQAALLGVFDSQISGGKRYDSATLGRRRAHGTFYQSHEVDEMRAVSYGMDLTSLVSDQDVEVSDLIREYIERFREDVIQRIERFTKK